MRIVRFYISGKVKYGVLRDSIIHSYSGTPFHNATGHKNSFVPDGNKYTLNELKLLAPCLPSKIIGMGLNYRSHAREFNMMIPAVPLIFLKPSTAIIGPEDNIVLPRNSERVDYEGELALVIGKISKGVPEDRVPEHILGYTCFNDVSERHNQKTDGQWTRAKGYDTFAPIGPWIETEVNPDDLKLETFLNGEIRQSTRTSDFIFRIPRIVSFISNVMTLLPGDIIATGTTSGIGHMQAGDIVEIKIENIGILKNSVIKQD